VWYEFRKGYYLITISVSRIIIVRNFYAYSKLAYQALRLQNMLIFNVQITLLVTKIDT
jgi:hypothetical protein